LTCHCVNAGFSSESLPESLSFGIFTVRTGGGKSEALPEETGSPRIGRTYRAWRQSPTLPTLLFVAQGGHRIHARGSTGGHVRRQESHGRQQEGDGSERDRIGGSDSVQEALQDVTQR
jgi:hypothetical protein